MEVFTDRDFDKAGEADWVNKEIKKRLKMGYGGKRLFSSVQTPIDDYRIYYFTEEIEEETCPECGK